MPNVCLAWLNEAGLCVALFGGLIIFRWGPPQPSFQSYVAMSLESATPIGGGKTAGDVEQDAERQKRHYQVMARVGLGLIIFGFAMQAVANFPLLQSAAGQ